MPVYDFDAVVPDIFEQRWGGDLPRVTTVEGATDQRLLRIAFEDVADATSDTPADVKAIPRLTRIGGISYRQGGIPHWYRRDRS